MSADSQQVPRVASEGLLSGTRIKKEKIDGGGANADADGNVVGVGDGADVKSNMEPQRAPATPVCTSPRVSNGFHNEDLFRDMFTGKFANLVQNTPAAAAAAAAKREKIRLMFEESIGDESKLRVQEIFSKVEQLKIEEKLLLYLKLPLSLSNPTGTIDPLKQPLNPLGNRYEIHQTIMWIKTHLEEDPDVSLPKQEVYDEYNMFCVKNSMKPLSTADFGKVMKQVYPRVRPRRLGTRGNSRYCYAGMRKKIKLDPPKLPIIAGVQSDESAEENTTEEMLGAASTVIREWAENLLGLKFPTLSALGRYLVENLFVDNRSMAAVCIVCDSGIPETERKEEIESPVTGKPAKMREAQLQLHRKLQQREHIRDQKQRQLENESPSQNKEKTVNIGKGGRKVNKKKPNQSPQGTNIGQGPPPVKGNTTPVPRQRKNMRNSSDYCSNVALQSNCDNLVVQSIEIGQKTDSDLLPIKEAKSTRNPRKRTSMGMPSQQTDSSPEKQAKHTDSISANQDRSCTPIQQSQSKISVILASSLKNYSEAADSQSSKNCDIDLIQCANSQTKLNGRSNILDDQIKIDNDHQIPLLENSSFLQRSNLGTIDQDSLDDYLNGGNNSQEQEEELLQYFQQGNSSNLGAEAGKIIGDAELSSRSDKVSELRFILQQNLKTSTGSGSLANPTPVDIPVKQEINDKTILSSMVDQRPNQHQQHQQHHTNTVNTRRRVSFETSVIEHDSATASHTVPQSPNTRRRIFNFTPISPGPHSPINGRASKCNSANASPFVSPRNTPVPRSRSNLQNGYRSRSVKKTLSRSISCSVPYTNVKNETFVVPTSGPETIRQVSINKSPLVVQTMTKLSEAQTGGHAQNMRVVSKPEQEQQQDGSNCNQFLGNLDLQKQLIINYPSMENLQEVKNIYQKAQPTDQEISDLLLNGEKQLKLVEISQATKEQLYCRSQSVPLYRMVNPTLMSPISSQPFLTPFRSFNASTSSSIAPTPVPSEFTDFCPLDASNDAMYLLEDANFTSEEQQFLMGEKEMSSENISNFLNILNEEPTGILSGNSVDQGIIESSSVLVDTLSNSYLNLSSESALDSGISIENGNLEKLIQSRSYPNTPLPMPISSCALPYTEDSSNGSRSYPTTPLHSVQPSREIYSESNEPMLSSPTLDTLNLRGDITASNSSESVCRSVADLLEPSFLDSVDPDAGDLDPLDSFEGLQDALPPLFNEVVEPNR